jgi:probable F420-dependent oxidoreductase
MTLAVVAVRFLCALPRLPVSAGVLARPGAWQAAAMSRWGLTVPQAGVGLLDHAALVRELPGWGYTDLWSAEVSGADAFVPLALASTWEPTLRLGTAIVPVFTRGPALIAMSAATMAAAAPGRFVLGLGASSPAIVESWNGLAFTEPFRRTRDVLRIVRQALAGERVDGRFDTVTISRFALESPPAVPPPVMLAALRPQMLRLAGQEADGAILNWLAASDVARCRDAVDAPVELVARVFVCPTEDDGFARSLGRRLIATYLTVPAYAAFHDWLGRGPALRAMHDAWAAGDRKGAAAAVPDEVVDSLVLHGSPESVRDQVQAYADAGVTTPVLALLPPPDVDLADVVRRLGPGA